MSIYAYRPALVFFAVLAALVGAVAGSFLNCAAWRIARGESFVRGRSRCPSCGHVLGAMELVPVLRWALQRGKCRWCGTRISARYPLTEIGFSLIAVLCLLRFDLTPLYLRNFLFLCCLFLLALTNLDAMIIPDGCLLAALVIWIAALPFDFPGWKAVGISALAALLFGGGLLGVSLVMDRLLGRDTMGGGDIKLFAVVGLYLGFIGTLFTLVIACIVGLAIGALIKRRRSGATFPFGPAIALAAGLMLLYGAPLIDWYGGLLT